MRPFAYSRLFAFLFALTLPAATTVAGTYAALVADIDSERVLYERNPDELRHPASLTKMMTLYLVFEALSQGRLFPDTLFRASRYAVLRPPSRLGLREGDTLTVEEGILGLVTRSANDAATTIAEGIAGSEPAFAAAMTEKARRLGMSSTVYRNASGLPDPQQVTTAWDMFRLGKALNKHFPQFYTYFSTASFSYQGHDFANHNHLMETYPGMDGIKTGFINASGFNLVASAQRNGHRLIGVVFGGPSAKRRDRLMRELLDDGFAQLEGAPPAVHIVEFDRQAQPVDHSETEGPEVIERAIPLRHPARHSRHEPARHAAAPARPQTQPRKASHAAYPAHPAQPLKAANTTAHQPKSKPAAEKPMAKKVAAPTRGKGKQDKAACQKTKCK